MIARHDGECAACHEPIHAGYSDVIKAGTHWIHRKCAQARWGE